eukprot:3146750-Lingulodinium_polyedra.AAC.1
MFTWLGGPAASRWWGWNCYSQYQRPFVWDSTLGFPGEGFRHPAAGPGGLGHEELMRRLIAARARQALGRPPAQRPTIAAAAEQQLP